MGGGVRAVNVHLASVYSTKMIAARSPFRTHNKSAQEMSTVIDAETTVTPDTTNMPALIDADNEIVWFPWHVMIHRPFRPNLVMEIVD